MGRRLPPLGRASERRRVREEVDEELRSHFEGTVALLVQRGMREEEARREAHRRFGDVGRWRLTMERIGHRKTTRRRGRMTLASVGTTLAFAWRSIRRRPGFAAAVVLTMTLGIGANLAMFGVVDRLLLSPPSGISEPEELRRVWVRRTDDAGVHESDRFAWRGFRDFEATSGVAGVAAYASGARMTLGEGPEAQRIDVRQVSGSYFPLLGGRAALGRLLVPGDDALDAPPVAVLSHAFWTRSFGGEPGVLGRQLRIGSGSYEVVGVAPPGFTGVELTPVDVWLPLLPSGVAENGEGWVDNRQWWWLRVVARLDDAAAEPATGDALTAAHRTGYAEQSRYEPGRAEIFTAPLLAALGPDPAKEARVARWLGGLSLLVLLATCANVANLYLARAERSRRPLAVRAALGVPRARMLAELLAESALLTLVGAALAAGTLYWAAGPLSALLLPDVAPEGAVVGRRLLAATVVIALSAALLAGLLPAWRTSRVDPGGALRSDGSRRTEARVRRGLVVFQAALSSALLVGAVLFVQSLRAARSVDIGFDAERVAVVRLERGEDPEGTASDLYRMAEESLTRLPGVTSAARVVAVPFSSSYALSVMVPGMDSTPNHPEAGTPRVDAVGADYFATMGIDILEGRGFEPADVGGTGEPVAVVTRSMADHVWPDGALDQCVRVGGPEADCARVVGVAENVSWNELREPPRLLVWLPQGNSSMRGATALAVRVGDDPSRVLPNLRAAAASLPSVRYVQVELLSDPLARLLRSWELGAVVLMAFGALAWLVAGIGLYGLLSFEVAQRRREMGVRKALGAQAFRLMSAMVAQGLWLATAGLLLGLGLAWAAADRIAPLLFDTSPRAPAAFALAGAALLAVALAATLPSGCRAARADPRESMRAE